MSMPFRTEQRESNGVAIRCLLTITTIYRRRDGSHKWVVPHSPSLRESKGNSSCFSLIMKPYLRGVKPDLILNKLTTQQILSNLWDNSSLWPTVVTILRLALRRTKYVSTPWYTVVKFIHNYRSHSMGILSVCPTSTYLRKTKDKIFSLKEQMAYFWEKTRET